MQFNFQFFCFLILHFLLPLAACYNPLFVHQVPISPIPTPTTLLEAVACKTVLTMLSFMADRENNETKMNKIQIAGRK